MKAFKLFFKIMRANLATVLMYLGIFIMIFNISLQAIGPAEDSELKLMDVKMTLFDQDQSQVSKAFTTYLSNNAQIIALDDNEESINDALFDGKTHYVVWIPKGFGDQMLDPESDNATLHVQKSIYAHLSLTAQQLIEGYNKNFQIYKMAYGGTIPAAHLESALQSIEADMRSDVQTHAQQTKTQNNLSYIAVGLSSMCYVIIALLSSTIGNTMVTMEEPEVKKRDLVGGMSEQKRALQIFLATLAFGVVVWIVLIGFSYGALGIDTLFQVGSIWLLLNSFVHLITILALVNFFTTLIGTKDGISFFSTTFSLLVAFFSGVFVPQSLLSGPVLRIASFFPTYWTVKANDTIANVSLVAPDYSPVLQSIGVMLLMATAYFFLTIVVRRRKQSVGIA